VSSLLHHYATPITLMPAKARSVARESPWEMWRFHQNQADSLIRTVPTR
jgi:hypothetical protein